MVTGCGRGSDAPKGPSKPRARDSWPLVLFLLAIGYWVNGAAAGAPAPPSANWWAWSVLLWPAQIVLWLPVAGLAAFRLGRGCAQLSAVVLLLLMLPAYETLSLSAKHLPPRALPELVSPREYSRRMHRLWRSTTARGNQDAQPTAR